MDGEVGEVLVDSEAMESISAGGCHSKGKVWGSTCVGAEDTKTAGSYAQLADEDGIFGYVWGNVRSCE